MNEAEFFALVAIILIARDIAPLWRLALFTAAITASLLYKIGGWI